MRMAPTVTRTLLLASAICVAAALVLARAGRSDPHAPSTARSRSRAADADPSEVQIGERLFLETRFAQYFHAHSGGDVNRPLAVGDPVVATLTTSNGPLPGPFAGTSMNCRGCHFVDDVDGASVNTYGDYSRRSRVPAREDGGTTTPRQSGGAYRIVLAGTAPSIPEELRLPPEYRLDVATATDRDIFDGVARLFVPDLATRTRRPDDFLPATPEHPHAREIFKAVPSHARPGAADLGLWNAFANPDFPGPQLSLRRALSHLGDTPESVLPKTLAYFKAPTLRDLGQSAPYLHTGRKREFEDVIAFYIDSTRKARQGKLRNASPELSDILLADGDVDPLAAFLRALNEDYS